MIYNRAKILFIFMLSTFSLNSNAIVFGNAQTTSNYGESVTIQIEVFNLYNLKYSDIDFKLINVINKEKSNKSYKIEIDKSFIQSDGLGWITIVTKYPIYNGVLIFTLELDSDETKGKRRYELSFYGKEKNRPDKTCKIESIRMKCNN
jgi:hypothetical protein